MFKLTQGPENRKAFLVINTADHKTWRAVRQTFYHMGKAIFDDAKTLIKRGPRGGKVYKFKGRTIRASASGEPPQRITGTLRKSLDFVVKGSDYLEVGAHADYASFLELGTSKMGKRPFLQTAVDKNKSKIENIVRTEYQREFGR